MKWIVAGLILVLVLSPILSPSAALGDGLFVWTNRQIDIVEPEQKAIIVYDDGLEELTLQVKFVGAPEEFGWIVPLPSTPRIRAARPDCFESMSRTTQVLRLAHSARASRLLSGPATSGSQSVESVHLLARDTVGIYDTATLSADEGDALSDWLKTHGFQGPPGASQVFTHYIRKGWVFVAMRIVPEKTGRISRNSLAEGRIQPVKFQFRTVRPVYPLKISSAMPGASEILLYVVAKRHLEANPGGPVAWDRQFHGPSVATYGLYDPSEFPTLGKHGAR